MGLTQLPIRDSAPATPHAGTVVSPAACETAAPRGLSAAEAAARIAAEGYNELPAGRRRGAAALALEIVREPMVLLLLGSGCIYLLLGDPKQALLLSASILIIVAIELYQENKTERALEALRDLSSPRALVIRDGVRRRIPGREVVRDDLLLLGEGDRVAADAVVLEALNLSADESLLTGESIPVPKLLTVRSPALTAAGVDEPVSVYAGTLVVKGEGLARVTATGVHTEIGRIGRTLHDIAPEPGALHGEIGRLVRVFAALGISVCLAAAVIYAVTFHSWLNGALIGLTLAISLTPEEFPVVLTVFLALGAWRMSQRRVLTRRVRAIETLGATTVLCVDKTGTITENRMSVQRLWADGVRLDSLPAQSQPLPEAFHELIEFAVLASKLNAVDPMERAFAEVAARHLQGTEHLHGTWRLVREYPLSREMLALTHVWASPDETQCAIAAKGAPEAIVELCHLAPIDATVVGKEADAMAAAGLRVLAVARASAPPSCVPEDQHGFDFELLGLIGLADPIRPSVPEAIAECYAAGLRVVMITGDYPVTAHSIAQQAGLTPSDAVLTGPELAQMSGPDLQHCARTTNVFARTRPEQKLRLVQALQESGEIVAMTGDGVNDAPALKAAQIGIAMGGRGTDVAREAAALVLLDDDFSSIVAAVRMGRRIYDNLKKAMAFLLAVHVPIAGLALIPLMLGWPMVLLPVHIVFLELIIDPACSIVFEAEREEWNVMRRPPRHPHQPLFSRRMVATGLLQGVSVLLFLLAVFAFTLHTGHDATVARSLSFAALISGNIALIFTNRSWSQGMVRRLRVGNAALWIVSGGALLMLGLVLYIPALSELFRFTAPAPVALALSVAMGFSSVLWFEAAKLWRRKRLRSHAVA